MGFSSAYVVCWFGFLFVFKISLNYSEILSVPVGMAFGKSLGWPGAAVIKHLVKKTLGLCSIAVVAYSFLICVLFSTWVFPEILGAFALRSFKVSRPKNGFFFSPAEANSVFYSIYVTSK